MLHKVYIANVTPTQCASWLHTCNVDGATITQGFGYWEGELEPQCTVELTCGGFLVAAFVEHVFHNTEERAVYYVAYNVSVAEEIHRTR